MIRRATEGDAAGIARVHMRCYRTAYAEICPPELQILEPDVELWRGRILDDDGIPIDVFAVGDEVSGFVAYGPDDHDGEDGLVMALYVDPAAQGAGVGTRLLAHALDAFRARGWKTAGLWTFVDNEAARRYYERQGWTVVEGSEEPHDRLGAMEIRYRRDL